MNDKISPESPNSDGAAILSGQTEERLPPAQSESERLRYCAWTPNDVAQSKRVEFEIDWIDKLSVDELKEILRLERTNSGDLATTLIRALDQKDALCRLLWHIVKDGYCTSLVQSEASITLLMEIAPTALLKEIKEYRYAREMDTNTPR